MIGRVSEILTESVYRGECFVWRQCLGSMTILSRVPRQGCFRRVEVAKLSFRNISNAFGRRLRFCCDVTGLLVPTTNLTSSRSYMHSDSTCTRSDMLSVDLGSFLTRFYSSLGVSPFLHETLFLVFGAWNSVVIGEADKVYRHG